MSEFQDNFIAKRYIGVIYIGRNKFVHLVIPTKLLKVT